MKKELIIFTLLFLIPFTLAVDMSFNPNIPSGETSIVKVSGSFIDPITKSSIEFYRGHTRTSFDYDVGKIGNDYYIYFQTLNKPENNYSINISGVRYYEGSKISNEPFSKQFLISSEQSNFYINPAFIITGGNSSFFIKNLKSSNTQISIEHFFGDSLKFRLKDNNLGSGESFILSSVEDENIFISFVNLNETVVGTITLSSQNTIYVIPIYLILGTEGTISSEDNSVSEENNSIIENKTESNSGSFWDIFKKENKTISSGNGTAINNNSIIKNGTIIEEDTTLKTCSQLKGMVCQSDQVCQNGEIVDAKDSKCCISSCVAKTESNSKKIIGWVLIGLIVIFLLWFRVKYNRTRRRKYSLPSKFNKRF